MYLFMVNFGCSFHFQFAILIHYTASATVRMRHGTMREEFKSMTLSSSPLPRIHVAAALLASLLLRIACGKYVD